MHKNKRILAIIPARGGSKRLPGKNILELAGKAMISWTIEAALNSKYIGTTIITSDNDKVLSIGKEYKTMTIRRPKELSGDDSSSIDAVIHALKQVSEKYDYVVLLQPTSPLRTSRHIDEAIMLLNEKNADAIISVSEMNHSPLWSNQLDDSLSMENFLDEEILNKRSQELSTFYRLNGAIYICNIKKLLKEKTFFIQKNIYAYKMDKESSVDIDDDMDFKLAELLFDN
ncbi:acylneuraminate cytidylyltransferase family protein [Arcobacter sp. HD9-500m-PIT-SAG03]|nr:acylneuraminate cytidylyltransferase family protein [Arcobacter sp. HD9-500m-PIT-SAG03]